MTETTGTNDRRSRSRLPNALGKAGQSHRPVSYTHLKKTLLELEKITELVAEEKNQIGKSLSLSVGPSIAPYILPKLSLIHI